MGPNRIMLKQVLSVSPTKQVPLRESPAPPASCGPPARARARGARASQRTALGGRAPAAASTASAPAHTSAEELDRPAPAPGRAHRRAPQRPPLHGAAGRRCGLRAQAPGPPRPRPPHATPPRPRLGLVAYLERAW